MNLHTARIKKLGKRPLIIPVFLSHEGCPHRCAFCNQHAMNPDGIEAVIPETLSRHVANHLKYSGKNRWPVEVAFYGGNFLGINNARVRLFLEAATALVEQRAVDGIRFSTRPDTITEAKLDMLSCFPITLVELGAQSMDDRVLSISGRGHTAGDTVKAAVRLKNRGLRLGIQLMVGLPGDTVEGSFASVKKIAALFPDCVRIYPTVVLKGSQLADWHSHGKYTPMPLDDCVSHVKQLYLYFQKRKIRVIRMGLQPSEVLQPGSHLIAGPFHPAFGHLVLSEIFRDAVVSHLESQTAIPKSVTLRIHPGHVSRMAGQSNRNIDFFRSRFQIESLFIRPDDSCPRDLIFVGDASIPVPC